MGCSTSKPDGQLKYKPARGKAKVFDDVLKGSGSPVYSGVSRGMDLLCRDEFSSMYSGETMYRWRPADCKDVEGSRHNRIHVHYTGWSESFDHWVDLDCEAGRICPVGLLPKEQTKEGGPLDAQQAAQAMNFFLHGSMDNLTHESGTSSVERKSSQPKETQPLSGRPFPGSPAAETSVGGSGEGGRGEGSGRRPSPAEEEEDDLGNPYSAGDMVDILDIFFKKNSSSPSQKWRPASVVEVDGPYVTVHYVNWDPKYDEKIHFLEHGKRIAEAGSMCMPLEQLGQDSGPGLGQRLGQGSGLEGNESGKSKTSALEGDMTEQQRKFTKSFQQYKRRAEERPKSSVSVANAHDKHEGGILKQVSMLTFSHIFGAPKEEAMGSTSSTASGSGGSGGSAGSAVEERDSEDEHKFSAIAEREKQFLETLEHKGLNVFAIEGDGNCLFRAVSHQLYLHQDMHEELRASCVEHLVRHRSRFEVFCFDQDFDQHVRNMSKSGTWGDDLEIRALEEITDRVITIYSSDNKTPAEPINNNFEERKLLRRVPPITLSYHGRSHYNSIYDERFPLPLEHRTSRLLLRSRIALGQQDNLPPAPGPRPTPTPALTITTALTPTPALTPTTTLTPALSPTLVPAPKTPVRTENGDMSAGNGDSGGGSRRSGGSRDSGGSRSGGGSRTSVGRRSGGGDGGGGGGGDGGISRSGGGEGIKRIKSNRYEERVEPPLHSKPRRGDGRSVGAEIRSQYEEHACD